MNRSIQSNEKGDLNMKKLRNNFAIMICIYALILTVSVAFHISPAHALTHSQKIALVPNAHGLASNGGSLPTSGFPGGYSPTFINLLPTSIRDNASDPIALGGFDTVVLVQIDDIQNWLSYSNFKNRIENFVSSGGKLIIWDSECTSNNYASFIYPFTLSAPGAWGSLNGDLWIVENNTLGTNATSSFYYVNTASMHNKYDIGDANVMVTYNSHWCTHMVAKNLYGVKGPVQTYARYGNGLIIWNGLDMDAMGGSIVANDTFGSHNLNFIWFLQLYQQWNPDNLPCGVKTSGITLTPSTSTNPLGVTHTVTATVKDNLGSPVKGVTVNFKIVSGPNAGKVGAGTTDVNGRAFFSWTSTKAGTDVVNATAQCPFNPAVTIYDTASKTWISPTIESCDSAGAKKDSFNPSETVYAYGSGYAPSTVYSLYVVPDVTWTNGMAILGTAISVSSDSSGNIPPTTVMSPPLTPGKYDIVVDVNGNGVYDAGVDALDDNDIQVTAGFLVIPELWFGALMGLAGCFAAFGTFRMAKRKRY
jgi:hypothetical protein